MIAIGGNSLSPKGETGGIHQQFANTRKTLKGISHFIDRGYNLCINHGNGPQVGNELMRMGGARRSRCIDLIHMIHITAERRGESVDTARAPDMR